MCGGGGKAPEPPKYRTADGREFDTAFEAQEHERMIRLARAMGYEGDFAPQTPAPAATGFGKLSSFVGNLEMAPGGSLMGGTFPFQLKQPPPDPFQEWLAEEEGREDTWQEFYDTGLTAGDYRQELRRREEEARREAAIAEGRELIDQQFGQFDDSYYDALRQSYLDYYAPQLQSQYDRALESVTFDLARRGALNSSAANKRLAELNEAFATQLGGITNQAEDLVAKQRAQVLQDRDALLGFNQSAADAEAVSERVGGATDRLSSFSPQLTPLGQVFYDFITPVADVVSRGIRAEQQGYPGWGVIGGKGYDTRNRRSYNEVN